MYSKPVSYDYTKSPKMYKLEKTERKTDNLIKQRIAGALFIFASVVFVLIALSSDDKDITCTLFTFPFGLYMILTKQYIFYK